MKKIKFTLLSLCLIVVIACSSDDNSSSTTPTTITANSTVSFTNFNSNIANITSRVTFNGQPAADYTVTAIKGDKIVFNFGAQKAVQKVTREIFMYDIDTTSGHGGRLTDEDIAFFENLTFIEDSRDSNFYSGFEIGPNAPENYDLKFDIKCIIKEDGVILPGEFFIDPKIKIRTSR